MSTGLTSILKPLGKEVNKSIKDYLKRKYLHHSIENIYNPLKVTREQMITRISKVLYQDLKKEIIEKSFLVTVISKSLNEN